MTAIGITSYGAYVPPYHITADEYAAAWGRFEARIERKAVPGIDEDAVTMGIDAAREVKIPGEPAALCVASTTWPQPGTLASGPIVRSLDLAGGLRTMEFGTSWKAGIEALDAALQFDSGLAVTTDAPQGTHTEDTEHILGAGAAAVATGESPIATLVDSAHYVDARLPAKFQRGDGRVIDLELGQYTVSGFARAVEWVVEEVLGAHDLTPADVDHVVLPQDDAKIAWRIGHRMGFDDEQLTNGFLVNQVGFAGTAAPLLGLVSALDASHGGDRVLVVGYGYGEGASAVLFETTDAVADTSAALAEKIEATEEISYMDYLKRRGGID